MDRALLRWWDGRRPPAPQHKGITMLLPGRRRRGLFVRTTVAGIVMAVAAGAAAASADAGAESAAATERRPADQLQRLVDAVHDTGTVGVSAESTSPDARNRARAGTAEQGTGRPMPWDGRFRIGSATKTFTAAVVLQLVGEGEMSLDDTVEHWLPGVVQGNGNDGSQVTVRQLLQHTSGIPDVLAEIPALNTADGYRAERYRDYTAEELVALAMRQTREFPPGTDWSYSNTNYVLAGMIIHEVTGRSWAQEVNSRIIRPLDLADTSTPTTFPFVRGPHAHGYAAFGTDTTIDVTELNPSMAVASGSIISTTHDLNRFYAALLDGRLLEPAEVDALTATVPAPELDPARYGLGLAEIPLSCGGSYYGHRGELLGYTTWVGVTPDGARTGTVYVTGDGSQDTQSAMMTLVDQELCRSGAS
ncbi:serine hydrolase domain-containing protein [Streptomyces sp. B6B3]|uniref:serine hydrolase domain-containing protein n=1 Tax=Streptomyces sp. B6B3 TaxID=3153570 RepID=UPI00325E067E